MAIQCQFTAIIAWLFLISMVLARNATRGGVSSAPAVKDSAEVEFYVLEASFPYNTPTDIKDTAGENFRDYGVTHGGLGVWDKSKDVKFTIEFISSDYVGALLPKFNEEGKTLVWSNVGEVVITTPIVESDWLNSQLISETTGVAYNQLIAYIRDNEELFDTFQPVEVDHYNSSSSSAGKVVVSSTGSFWFVRLLIRQLSDYGADTSSFMQIHATAFQYIAQSLLSPEVVAWSPNGPSNAAVYSWYRDLTSCYQASYSDTKNSSSGDAKHFLQLVKQCYGAYAYIYLSDTSVYNVSLANVSSTYSTPDLQRYLFVLPDSSDKSKSDLQVIDMIVIAAVGLGVLLGTFLLTRKLCCTKPKRRRLSLDGEKVAERTVDSIVGARLEQEGHEEQVYYKISSLERWTRWTSNVSSFVSSRKSAARSGAGSSGDILPHNFMTAVLSSDRQPNSSDSDPSSDLVRPLAGQRLSDEHADLQYMDRLAQEGRGGGYVSPSLSLPPQQQQSGLSYAAVAASALEADEEQQAADSSSIQQV